MGTLKKRIADPTEIRQSECSQSGHEPPRRRDLFFALPDSVRARRPERRAAYFKQSGLYVYRRDLLLQLSRTCPSVHSNRPNAWNSCVRLKTAIASAWSKRNTSL